MCPCPEWAERRGKWKSLCRKEGQGPGARQAGDKGHGVPGPPVSSIQVPPGSKEDPRLQAAGWGPGQGPQAGPGVRLRPLQRCWWNPKLWNTHTRTCRHTHYLRISRSKAADVVVDLLEDKAPVHEGETSLRRKQPTKVSIQAVVESWVQISVYCG